jgi:hypothetical protein
VSKTELSSQKGAIMLERMVFVGFVGLLLFQICTARGFVIMVAKDFLCDPLYSRALRFCEFRPRNLPAEQGRGVNYHPAVGEFPQRWDSPDIRGIFRRGMLALRIRYWNVRHPEQARKWKGHLDRNPRPRIVARAIAAST